MTSPVRIQRRRTKGWRKPAGAIYVGGMERSRWGNNFDWRIHGRQKAVELFRQHLLGSDALVAAARRELRGHDLMCWCPLDQPCHADVLLEVANV